MCTLLHVARRNRVLTYPYEYMPAYELQERSLTFSLGKRLLRLLHEAPRRELATNAVRDEEDVRPVVLLVALEPELLGGSRPFWRPGLPLPPGITG